MNSLNEIYHTHSRMVYNLALHYTQNREDAEEITQDVFVAVHESLSSFREEASIKTWLYRITINKSLDFLKAKSRKKRFGFFTSLFYEDSGEVKHDLPEFEHPGIKMEQKEDARLLFACINELPDNQKTALLLTKIEGKSYAEAAEIMNTTAKAIESLIQRAKANLSKKINISEG